MEVWREATRESRIRRHNLGTTAKQAAMVWACVGKRLWKKTVRHVD